MNNQNIRHALSRIAWAYLLILLNFRINGGLDLLPDWVGYNRNGTACAVRRWLCRPVNSNSGWQVLMVGGNWNDGSIAGLFYFNANNSSSNSNGNIGARLLVFLMSSLRRLFRTAW